MLAMEAVEGKPNDGIAEALRSPQPQTLDNRTNCQLPCHLLLTPLNNRPPVLTGFLTVEGDTMQPPDNVLGSKLGGI